MEPRFPNQPLSIAWSPDSDRIWVLATNGGVSEINQLDEPTLNNRGELLGNCQRLYAFRDKDHLLGIDSQGVLHRWDGESQLHETVQIFNALPEETEIDASGRWLAHKNSSVLGLTNATNGKLVWSRDLKTNISDLRFLPDGSLVAGGANGIVYLLSQVDGHELAHGAPHRKRYYRPGGI